MVTVFAEPTPGVAGYLTNTLTFTIFDPVDRIIGFDGKFIGPMNQVNPFTQATVYQDNNVMFGFIGSDVKRDSQFLFKTTTADTVNGVLAERGGESSSLLDGAFEMNRARLNPNAGQGVRLVQLVLPAGANVPEYLDSDSIVRVRNGRDAPRVPGLWPISFVFVNATVASEPTPGKPGYETKTITYTMMDPSISIIGFDGKFVGAMNQVDPSGLPTVFQDNNALFGGAGADVKQDSQFLFKTTDGDPVNGVLVTRSAESATLLDASFTLKGGRDDPLAGPSVTIAQLVVPAGASVLQYMDPAGHVVTSPIPEPMTTALLVPSLAALLLRRRRGATASKPLRMP
jgi:hypothetical protein